MKILKEIFTWAVYSVLVVVTYTTVLIGAFVVSNELGDKCDTWRKARIVQSFEKEAILRAATIAQLPKVPSPKPIPSVGKTQPVYNGANEIVRYQAISTDTDMTWELIKLRYLIADKLHNSSPATMTKEK